MTSAPGSVLVKSAVIASMAAALFVMTVRPVTRPTGSLSPHLGLTRMSLLCEASDVGVGPMLPSIFGHRVFVAPALVLGSLLLVLKARRSAFCPTRLRRLKLPSRRPKHPSSSH